MSVLARCFQFWLRISFINVRAATWKRSHRVTARIRLKQQRTLTFSAIFGEIFCVIVLSKLMAATTAPSAAAIEAIKQKAKRLRFFR